MRAVTPLTALAFIIAVAVGGREAVARASAQNQTHPITNVPTKSLGPVVKATSEGNIVHNTGGASATTTSAATRATHEGGQFTRSTTGKLDFHARDIDVAEALGQLRRLLHKNIIVSPEIRQHFSGDLYDVTPEEAVQAICRSTGLASHEEGAFLYIGAAELQSRIFHLSYMRAEDMAPLVAPALSSDGKLISTASSEIGITPSQDHAGGNTYSEQDAISVLDYPRNLNAVAELVHAFDVRPRQILIEATIMAATLNDELQYGVEVTGLHNLDLSTATADFVTQSVNIGNVTLDQTQSGSGSAQTELLRGISTEGLKVGFFKGGVGAFLRALQSKTAVEVLATPRVITLNKQRGEVLLGRRDGYLTSTTTQTSTTQTVQFLETGTRLVYRPFITSDGYVRLEIHPEDSNGGLNSMGLPFKDTAELTTNVLVKDNDTLVIGGLFRSRKSTVDKQVPWLGDIPIIGELFKSQDHVTVREEIVVLLTPRILDGDASVNPKDGTILSPADKAAAASRGNDPPRDTERLAQAYLDAARNRLESRDASGAMILLDAASMFGARDPSIAILRREAGRSMIAETSSDSVDDVIVKKVLRDAASERAREPGR